MAGTVMSTVLCIMSSSKMSVDKKVVSKSGRGSSLRFPADMMLLLDDVWGK